jgi:adenosine deaminase
MTAMKNAIPLLLVGILFAGAAQSAHAADKGSDLRATSAYYKQLITGSQANGKPQLAELTMLMNMMPKGGDLHHHYSGAIYAESYLDWVEKQNYCIYRNNFHIEMGHPSAADAAQKGCVNAAAVRADNDLYRNVLTHWSSKDFDKQSHEQEAPDQHFFKTFGYFWPASLYAPNEGLKLLKERAKAENLQYIETMLFDAPTQLNAAHDALMINLPPDATPQQIDHALQRMVDSLAADKGFMAQVQGYRNSLEGYAANLDDDDFSLRIQAFVLRVFEPSKVFSSLYAAFNAANNSKSIVGVNIVAPENDVVSMRDYRLHMHMFRFLKQKYPAVHVDLHAGELTLGLVPPEGLRSHIRDAITIGQAERIGHGIDIVHEDNPDLLLKMMRDRDIPVEINLTSNAFILGVKDDAHPVSVYLRNHVPIVIGSDDPGVSRNNLSGEYMLFASRYQPSYATLKQVVYNGIRYSFMNTLDKRKQIDMLDKRFLQFEKRIAALHAKKK